MNQVLLVSMKAKLLVMRKITLTLTLTDINISRCALQLSLNCFFLHSPLPQVWLNASAVPGDVKRGGRARRLQRGCGNTAVHLLNEREVLQFFSVSPQLF